jgi:hypothetical protein
MAKPMRTQTDAQRNAERYFRRAEQQPDTLGKQIRKWARTANATNPAAENDAGDKLAAEDGAAEPALRRERVPTVRSILRMPY